MHRAGDVQGLLRPAEGRGHVAAMADVGAVNVHLLERTVADLKADADVRRWFFARVREFGDGGPAMR